MGDCAELCAKEKTISRADQDAFAAESYRRALRRAGGRASSRARSSPSRSRSARDRRRSSTDDEEPGRGDIEKLPALRPAFQKDGTVTAGNASSINDGAAALVLAGADVAEAQRAANRSRAWSARPSHAQAPEWFTTAPAGAIERLLARVGWSKDDVDLWEINEAFAVVAIANNQHARPRSRPG